MISSSLNRPTRENQPATARGRKVETFAATAAAVLGMMLSKTENVSLGSQLIEEDAAKPHPRPAVESTDGSRGGQPAEHPSAKPAAPQAEDGELLPWIRLKPQVAGDGAHDQLGLP
jgi:hypothetical protein